MRTFGVEEELLLVDSVSLEPIPIGDVAVSLRDKATLTGHSLTTEFKQEQLEVNSPPQHTLAAQLDAIRAGRALAQEAARLAGGQVAALPLVPMEHTSHLVPEARNRMMVHYFGATAREQLTNGFHIHVAIDSDEEAVAAMDRIRVWLPLLLALSSNSPFWHGGDTDFASYRYQAWNRWPTSGPTEIFGSATEYAEYRQALLKTGVPLDAGMLYFDVRPSDHQPTLEIRVADVCLKAEHAAVIAALARALVETALRHQHEAPLEIPATVLQLWTWQASRYGVEAELVHPHTGTLVPAADAIAELLNQVRPVLEEYGEDQVVEQVVSDILDNGAGAQIQRRAYERRQDIRDVMQVAIEKTLDDQASQHLSVAAKAAGTPEAGLNTPEG